MFLEFGVIRAALHTAAPKTWMGPGQWTGGFRGMKIDQTTLRGSSLLWAGAILQFEHVPP
jgi:hypothetical protein